MEKIEIIEYEIFKYVWECPKCFAEYRKTNVYKQSILICKKCKTKIYRDDTESNLWRIKK